MRGTLQAVDAGKKPTFCQGDPWEGERREKPQTQQQCEGWCWASRLGSLYNQWQDTIRALSLQIFVAREGHSYSQVGIDSSRQEASWRFGKWSCSCRWGIPCRGCLDLWLQFLQLGTLDCSISQTVCCYHHNSFEAPARLSNLKELHSGWTREAWIGYRRLQNR